MALQSPLYIVASPNPRVGKTLIARLLIEFFRGSDRAVVGYDLDPREPALARYFPDLVYSLDITETLGQMALFDRLIANDSQTAVIDLGYSLFDRFFAVMGEIGFEQEAQRRRIEPVVLFIADSAPLTLRSYAEIRRLLPQTVLVPVHNEAVSFMYIAKDFPPTRAGCSVIRLPRLSPAVRGVIERPRFSFADYLAKQPHGTTEIHTWAATIFAEFRDLELRLLMGRLGASLSGIGLAPPRESRSAG